MSILTDNLNIKFYHKIFVLMTTSTDKLNIANIKARLASPSPKIFKTIGNILVAIGSAGGAVLAVAIASPALIPASIITTAVACVAVGGIGRFITALTATVPPALVNQNNIVNLPETKTP